MKGPVPETGTFATCMTLLTATSAFGLGRKRWSSQHCYLQFYTVHCLLTIVNYYYYYICLTASTRTNWISRHQKGKTRLKWGKRWWGFGMHHSMFTGRMPFLPPNQQCQSTEGCTLWSRANIRCESKLFIRWQQWCGRSLTLLHQPLVTSSTGSV